MQGKNIKKSIRDPPIGGAASVRKETSRVQKGKRAQTHRQRKSRLLAASRKKFHTCGQSVVRNGSQRKKKNVYQPKKKRFSGVKSRGKWEARSRNVKR